MECQTPHEEGEGQRVHGEDARHAAGDCGPALADPLGDTTTQQLAQPGPAGDDDDIARPFHPWAAGPGAPRCVAVGGVGRVARPGEVRVAVGGSPETGEEGLENE